MGEGARKVSLVANYAKTHAHRSHWTKPDGRVRQPTAGHVTGLWAWAFFLLRMPERMACLNSIISVTYIADTGDKFTPSERRLPARLSRAYKLIRIQQQKRRMKYNSKKTSYANRSLSSSSFSCVRTSVDDNAAAAAAAGTCTNNAVKWKPMPLPHRLRRHRGANFQSSRE